MNSKNLIKKSSFFFNNKKCRYYNYEFKPTWSIKNYLKDINNSDKEIKNFDKICELSKLTFNETEKEKFKKDLSKMIVVILLFKNKVFGYDSRI